MHIQNKKTLKQDYLEVFTLRYKKRQYSSPSGITYLLYLRLQSLIGTCKITFI